MRRDEIEIIFYTIMTFSENENTHRNVQGNKKKLKRKSIAKMKTRKQSKSDRIIEAHDGNKSEIPWFGNFNLVHRQKCVRVYLMCIMNYYVLKHSM